MVKQIKYIAETDKYLRNLGKIVNKASHLKAEIIKQYPEQVSDMLHNFCSRFGAATRGKMPTEALYIA